MESKGIPNDWWPKVAWKRILALFLLIGLIRAADIRPQVKPGDARVAPGPPARETFVPDDIRSATVAACGVRGNPDKTNDAFVIVEYEHRAKAAYRALISRRGGQEALVALEDCRVWFEDVQRDFRKK